MKNNKICPLDELRQEKEILRRECSESEERLGEHWSYFQNNVSSLLFQSAVGSFSRKLGFGGSSSSKDHKDKGGGGSLANGLFQGALGGLIASAPILWDLAQPMIIRFVVKKIKSIFTGGKKKKKE